MGSSRDDLLGRGAPAQPYRIPDHGDHLSLDDHNLKLKDSLDRLASAAVVGAGTGLRLGDQDAVLARASTRMHQIISKIPGIGGLSRQIQHRRRRDRVILGVVIGFLLFVLVAMKI